MIDAADARADPRTRDLGPTSKSRNIGALLDAPVFVQNRTAGSSATSTSAEPRWSTADQEFALAISQTVVARLEAHARNQSAGRGAAGDFAEWRPRWRPRSRREVADIAVRRALPILGEMATLAAYEGGTIRYRSVAHVSAEGESLLADWLRRIRPASTACTYLAGAP